MTTADTFVPLNRVTYETAAEHATRNVPVAGMDTTAGEIRCQLAGRAFESAAHIVVLRGVQFAGLIRIEDVLAAGDDARAAGLMDTETPVVAPGVDQEVAASRAAMRGESALAVVDARGNFAGLIPPHRLLAVLLAEHEEDLSRLGGFLRATASVRSSTAEPVRRRFEHRLPWLLVGLAGALLSADVVSWFEENLRGTVMLAFFIPAIVYLADAVGTQTETIVVRGLSVGADIRPMFRGEAAAGLAIGLAIALVAAPIVFWRWGEADVAVGLGLSLFAACSTATFVAMLLPWGLDRAGLDPAFGSGPLATVVQDLLSIVIYFSIMTAMVG